MTDSRGCEHEGTKVETASNRLNGVADPEGATLPLLISRFLVSLSLMLVARREVTKSGDSFCKKAEDEYFLADKKVSPE